MSPDRVVAAGEVVDQLTFDEQQALQSGWAADNARLADRLKPRLAQNQEVSLTVEPHVRYLSLVRVLSALRDLGITSVLVDVGRGPTPISIGSGVYLKPPDVGLLILFVHDGVSVKGPGGNVAPGCQSLGPGVAVPHRNATSDYAGYDYPRLRDCIARVIAASGSDELRSVFALANPDVPFQNFIDATRAIEEAGARLAGLRLLK